MSARHSVVALVGRSGPPAPPAPPPAAPPPALITRHSPRLVKSPSPSALQDRPARPLPTWPAGAVHLPGIAPPPRVAPAPRVGAPPPRVITPRRSPRLAQLPPPAPLPATTNAGQAYNTRSRTRTAQPAAQAAMCAAAEVHQMQLYPHLLDGWRSPLRCSTRFLTRTPESSWNTAR